ncbi:hypothetical protein ACIKT0_13755 [Hansschlegelia beijingensis]|uniref:hypothetical protein n=1 Tax=Hansschlegelia beijingensis TaxID=1133344 RepID=UPI00387F1AF2
MTRLLPYPLISAALLLLWLLANQAVTPGQILLGALAEHPSRDRAALPHGFGEHARKAFEIDRRVGRRHDGGQSGSRGPRGVRAGPKVVGQQG